MKDYIYLGCINTVCHLNDRSELPEYIEVVKRGIFCKHNRGCTYNVLY